MVALKQLRMRGLSSILHRFFGSLGMDAEDSVLPSGGSSKAKRVMPEHWRRHSGLPGQGDRRGFPVPLDDRPSPHTGT